MIYLMVKARSLPPLITNSIDSAAVRNSQKNTSIGSHFCIPLCTYHFQFVGTVYRGKGTANLFHDYKHTKPQQQLYKAVKLTQKKSHKIKLTYFIKFQNTTIYQPVQTCKHTERYISALQPCFKNEQVPTISLRESYTQVCQSDRQLSMRSTFCVVYELRENVIPSAVNTEISSYLATA